MYSILYKNHLPRDLVNIVNEYAKGPAYFVIDKCIPYYYYNAVLRQIKNICVYCYQCDDNLRYEYAYVNNKENTKIWCVKCFDNMYLDKAYFTLVFQNHLNINKRASNRRNPIQYIVK